MGNTKIAGVMLVALVLLITIGVDMSAGSEQISLYVAPQGDGDGTDSSPCSLQQARAKVMEANQEMEGDITVYLDGGLYKLDSPFVLSPQDSGSNGYTVHWRNKPGARPVFTGAEVVTNWSLHDEDKNIWKASVPEGVDFEHLWVNDRRMHRAWSGWNPPGFINTWRGVKLEPSGPDVPIWGNLEDMVVTKKFMWRHIPCRVQGIRSCELLLDQECVDSYDVPDSALGVMIPIALFVLNTIEPFLADFAIENAYELLTDSGEWYLDRSSSTLYYKPFGSDDFDAQSEAVYSNLETFILIDGAIDNPVKNISIEGLVFQYNRGTKMGVSAGSTGIPTLFIPAKPQRNAVQINGGQSITIKSNLFMHIAFDALHFDLAGKDLRIVGNGFCDVSRAAISLNQTNLVLSEDSKNGIIPENGDKFFDGVEISNNYIRYAGIDDHGGAIVFSEFARNIECFHNEISEVSTFAIQNGWRFLGWKGHAGNIEYGWNKASNTILSGGGDFGALYIGCDASGQSSIHHNFIDGVGPNTDNNAIYLDVFAQRAKVHNNVCINMPEKGQALIGRAWLGLIMSEHNEIYDNWTDTDSVLDMSLPDYRFWPSKTNVHTNNYVHTPDKDDWPEGAKEVMEKAGLEPEYQSIKEAVDSELDKGYMPLTEIYSMPGKQLMMPDDSDDGSCFISSIRLQ